MPGCMTSCFRNTQVFVMFSDITHLHQKNCDRNSLLDMTLSYRLVAVCSYFFEIPS